jgi:hypothetical protein
MFKKLFLLSIPLCVLCDLCGKKIKKLFASLRLCLFALKLSFWASAFFLFFLLMQCSLSAHLVDIFHLSGAGGKGQAIVIDANNVNYEGKELYLSGDIIVKHELGSLFSQEALLSRPLLEEGLPFALLELWKGVTLKLSSGGVFSCSLAALDLEKLTGHFFSEGSDEFVTFKDSVEHGKGPPVDILFKSKRMVVEMSRGDEGSKELSRQVRAIQAEEEVSVDYNWEFLARGDKMLYERDLFYSTVNTVHPMPGKIFIRRDKKGGLCQVESRRGDFVKAQEMIMDLLQQRVLCTQPDGYVFVGGEQEAAAPVCFSAKKLSWDYSTHLLTLEEQVTFSHQLYGKIQCSESVQISQQATEGVKQLQWVRATGIVEVDYADQKMNDHHKVSCFGGVFIDAIKRRATFSSPAEQDKQILFTNSQATLYANDIVIDYEQEGAGQGGFKVKKINITGNVKILRKGSEGEYSQYALAHAVEYLPEVGQMFFRGTPEKRVLFCDNVNKLEVSAPAVNLTRDPQTGLDRVQGVGDVRIAFMEDEKAALKENFSKGFWPF